jgi:hypothetical protein
VEVLGPIEDRASSEGRDSSLVAVLAVATQERELDLL